VIFEDSVQAQRQAYDRHLMGAGSSPLFGIPVYYSDLVPNDAVYLVNSNQIVIGTYVPPTRWERIKGWFAARYDSVVVTVGRFTALRMGWL
jgi:hypothetical protein